MRTIKTEVNVYTFDELSEHAKQAALDSLRDVNVDHGWAECSRIDLGERLSEQGLRLDNAFFSGFSSQGDGACLEVTLISLDKFLKHFQASPRQKALARKLDLGFESRQQGRYYHSGSLRLSVSMDSPSDLRRALCDELEESLKQHVRDLSDDFYKSLETEYNFLTSDAVIKESIEANEYEFSSEGKLI